MTEHHAAIVIGAGWAGLSVSFKLRQAGIDHVVLVRDRVCETWRSQRWDTFRMNTPNVLTVLPGDQYIGNEPEGYRPGTILFGWLRITLAETSFLSVKTPT